MRMTLSVSPTTREFRGNICEPSHDETHLVLSDQSLYDIIKPLEAALHLQTSASDIAKIQSNMGRLCYDNRGKTMSKR